MKTILRLLLLTMFLLPHAAAAQEPSIPIDQNFPQSPAKRVIEPRNAEEFSKAHFKKCLERDHLGLTTRETELICGCSASNMVGVMNFDEMKAMSLENSVGKNARAKFLTFAYAPCIEYLTTDVTKADCMSGEAAKDIRIGKFAVCKCAAEKMVGLIKVTSAGYIDEAVKREPMNIDPMDAYFSSKSYQVQRDGYIRECAYQMAYERDNR